MCLDMNIHTTIECLITSVLTLKILPLQHSKEPGAVVVKQ